MASSSCNMVSKMISGALPSMVGSVTATAGTLACPLCKPLDRMVPVRAMANAAQSDIPVNRPDGAGPCLPRSEDRAAPARRGVRGRRGGELIPFGGMLDLWDPFTSSNRSLKQMLDVVDRVFDDSLRVPFGRTGTVSPARGFRTPWDVVETDSEFHLRFDLPGFAKDEVKVTMEDRSLVVQAEKRESGDDKFGERSRSTFYTRVELPENVKANDIKAQLKNGVLEITVPKTKHEPHRQEIDVKVADE